MLRERYAPMTWLDLVPTLRRALDPVLTPWDRLLDDDTRFQPVKADLAHRLPRTLRDGRPSPPVEVILRRRVVQPLSGWSYEATERGGSARGGGRQCCRVAGASVPEETTLLRWANRIHPAPLPHLLNHVVELARTLQVPPGRTLRIDGTVVATPIHPPTDSPVLYEGVRGLGRTRAKARAVLPQPPPVARDAVQERPRSATRQMKRLMEAARQRGTEAAARMRTAYQGLLTSTPPTGQPAQHVGTLLPTQATPRAKHWAAPLAHGGPVGGQVIPQPPRRVLQGAAVPAAATRGRWFAPHTAISRTGQPGQPPAFGRAIGLDEGAGGSIRRYAVLDGKPAEAAQLPPRLEQHLRVFHRPPRLLVGDRGGHSTATEQYAGTRGVTEGGLPKPGAKSAQRIASAQQRWFPRGPTWRGGIEGRRSGLKRRHKLARCRSHGSAGMERWVGGGVITPELRGIAQATAAEPAREVPSGERSLYGVT